MKRTRWRPSSSICTKRRRCFRLGGRCCRDIRRGTEIFARNPPPRTGRPVRRRSAPVCRSPRSCCGCAGRATRCTTSVARAGDFWCRTSTVVTTKTEGRSRWSSW
uniref:(northern house mosquito) hypothetical protein n=1 Tax=Culex pipiens TaxID=7175 RepID=A0A8D8AKA5_CULPI